MRLRLCLGARQAGDSAQPKARLRVALEAPCSHRAHPLESGVRRLLSSAPIAQLDRATDYGSVGWGFDSSWVHQSNQSLTVWADEWDGARGHIWGTKSKESVIGEMGRPPPKGRARIRQPARESASRCRADRRRLRLTAAARRRRHQRQGYAPSPATVLQVEASGFGTRGPFPTARLSRRMAAGPSAHRASRARRNRRRPPPPGE
jgi:hypothetical protein